MQTAWVVRGTGSRAACDIDVEGGVTGEREDDATCVELLLRMLSLRVHTRWDARASTQGLESVRWTASGLEVDDGGCTAGEDRGCLFPGWLCKWLSGLALLYPGTV